VKFLRIDPMDSCIDTMLQAAGHEVRVFLPPDEPSFIEALQESEGLILRSRFKLTAELLQKAPSLKLIGRAGSGLESIDLEAATNLGIHVVNSPEGNRDAVGEHCVALLLGLLKKIPAAHHAVSNGVWDRQAYTGSDLYGKTIGIVGFGNTGKAFARRIQGFGVRVVAYDKYRSGPFPYQVQELSFEALLDEVDVLSFHLPLADDTRHVFSFSMLEKLAKPCYLINTSRGQVVDNRALLQGLTSGKILGAGLDVLEAESHRYLVEDNNKGMVRELARFPNVILTPHVAGISPASLKGIAEVLACKLMNLPLPQRYRAD